MVADIQSLPFYLMMLTLLIPTLLFSASSVTSSAPAWSRSARRGQGRGLGVDATRYKVTAYAASAFFIGVAGGLYAYFLTFLTRWARSTSWAA